MKRLLPILLLGLLSTSAFAADPNNCREVFESFQESARTGYGKGIMVDSITMNKMFIDSMNAYQTCRVASALETIAERMK